MKIYQGGQEMKLFHKVPLDTEFKRMRGVIVNTGIYKGNWDAVVQVNLLLSLILPYKRIFESTYFRRYVVSNPEMWIRFYWIRDGWFGQWHVCSGMQAYLPDYDDLAFQK